MPNTNEPSKAPFPKPVELMIADVFYIRLNRRTNYILFKDFSDKDTHYSIFNYGTTIDVHKTLETESNPLKRHPIQIKTELDLQFLTERIVQDIWTNRHSIFQRTTTKDPEWQDLKVEFMPLQRFAELVKQIRKGNRWNADTNFLDKLEKSIQYANLGELTTCGFIIGTSPEGYFVLSNGTDCWILDHNKLSKVIDRNLELSIRRIHLKYYTLRLVFWCVKIRLLNLNRIVVDYLRSRKRQ